MLDMLRAKFMNVVRSDAAFFAQAFAAPGHMKDYRSIAGIILDVEATPAHRTAEVESAKTMINRVEERFALKATLNKLSIFCEAVRRGAYSL